MAKNYLSVVYDEKSHPYNDYPEKLCAYLFQSFGLKISFYAGQES